MAGLPDIPAPTNRRSIEEENRGPGIGSSRSGMLGRSKSQVDRPASLYAATKKANEMIARLGLGVAGGTGGALLGCIGLAFLLFLLWFLGCLWAEAEDALAKTKEFVLGFVPQLAASCEGSSF